MLLGRHRKHHKERVALIITSQHFNLLCLLLNPPDWIAISTCISCIHSAAQTKSAQKAAEWSQPAVRHWRHPARGKPVLVAISAGASGKLPPGGCRVITAHSLLSAIRIIIIINAIPIQMNPSFLHHSPQLKLIPLSYLSLTPWRPVPGLQWLLSSDRITGCPIISSCPDTSRYVSSCQLSCLTARLITGNSPETDPGKK